MEKPGRPKAGVDVEKPDPRAVLKAVLSSLDDDLLDMTDEEVKRELADAGVDLAESERRWLKLERDALARLRGEKP